MGLGSGTAFLKNQTRVRVRVLGLKIFQKKRVLGSVSKPGTGSFASLQLRKDSQSN
jgi:hypothetical protein